MNIVYYPTAQEVNRALVEEVFLLPSMQGDVHVALSGGSTPRALFELLASPVFAEEIDWERIHLYWVDERCVPPTDAQSNYGMTHNALLAHVPIPEANIHRIRGEASPQNEARRYTEELRECLPTKNGQPVFDFVLLGIGDDGHTSSIFPHQMDLLDAPEPYVVATSPSGQMRVALSGSGIVESERIIYHAMGEVKREVLRRITHDLPEGNAYPATHIARRRKDISLYTDQSV